MQRSIFPINTDLVFIGQKERINGVMPILKKKTYNRDLPLIIIGDFNAETTSDVAQHVLSDKIPTNLVNSRDIAIIKNDSSGTFRDFGKLPKNQREYIDYFSVRKRTQVLE